MAASIACGQANLSRVEARATEASAERLGDDAVGLLSALIQLDTVNPPGNEAPAQELLAETLTDAGFECELLAAEPGRPNLLARLRGDAEGPTLCLLGHTDTVVADPADWSFDPWVGDVAGGEVRGRGAQDMKGQVAAEVAAAASLGREGWRPARGELLIAAVADEETGGHLGARWLCSEHREKVRSDFVINEGGGTAFEIDGRRHYPLCVGEKGVFRFKVRTHGRAGHASIPGMGENALLKLVPLLARLAEQPPIEPTPEGVEFLATLIGEHLDEAGPEELVGALERLRERNPTVAAWLAEPMLRVTLTPTKIEASKKANVIPARAEVLVDCRVPPGLGEDDVRDRLRGILGVPGLPEHEVEFTERDVGNRSPAEGPLADAIAAWVGEADPGAGTVPIVMPGFSDSNWFRRAFPEATVYGFCPQREMLLEDADPLVHGADERVKAADVELAARFFRDVAVRVLG
jgi:acetylornithine deacetylase/succinyl-diaminopimelate desuccinylase-like protein